MDKSQFIIQVLYTLNDYFFLESYVDLGTNLETLQNELSLIAAYFSKTVQTCSGIDRSP